MVECSTGMEPKPTATDAAAAPDDARLIEKIVRDRDREAFAELVKRFEIPAFQLALHLAGRRALAEEAVQDALLAVWHGAESFRSGGDLRRWILGIVAHRAMRAVRKERKSVKAMDYERERQRTAPEGQRPEEGTERGELLGALRELLCRLPEVERNLVALYYGAGMSQEEIGAALDMPQRTVSFKLQACLERLRKNLAQAGMAAAAPLVTPQLLGSVFASGPEAAPGLAAKTLARCDMPYALRESGARSARAGAAGGSKALVASAVLAVAVAAGAFAMLNHSSGPAAPATSRSDSPPTATPAVETASPAPMPVETPVPPAELRTWTFTWDKAPAEGFEYIQGVWRRGTFGPQHHTGLIAGTEMPYNAFILPKLGYRLPLKATIRFQAIGRSPINLGLGWSDGEQSFGARHWKGGGYNPVVGKDVEFTCYFMKPYTVSMVGDWIGTVSEDVEPVDRSRIFFTAANVAVASIEIREVTAEEIPPAVRDVEALLRTRTKTPEVTKGYRWIDARVRPLAQYLKEQAEKTD